MDIKLPSKFHIYLLVFLEICLLASCNGGKKDSAMKKKCEACKLLTDNFKKGMEKTERFMYDGGDADWEEKKLGSYATSEMRFIEITESLCENKEHDCHTLFETKEEMLEDWWKNHQEEHPDLFLWFCQENYQVCCPENTFGPDCTECPFGIERPCKGNGKCLGAGTRAGSGKCKCNAGYKGDLCDVCKDGFFEVSKNETHTVCKACHKSCTALCTSLGPKGCKNCKAGWLWDEEEGCQDIDECKVSEPLCGDQEFCENTEGSFKCTACNALCDRCLGPGKDQCVKCKAGNEMKEDGCGDIDECEQEGICTNKHMSCHNIPGSYYCDCAEGYERVGGECMDKEISNNESNHTSEESSGELESTTGEEGESDDSASNGGTIFEENSNERTEKHIQNNEEYIKNVDENDQILDQTLKNGDFSQEIPHSPDDLEDVFDQNESLQAVNGNENLTPETNQDIKASDSRVEL